MVPFELWMLWLRGVSYKKYCYCYDDEFKQWRGNCEITGTGAIIIFRKMKFGFLLH